MSTKTNNYFEIPIDITIKSTISIPKEDACSLTEAIFLAQKVFSKRCESGTVLDFVEVTDVVKAITVNNTLAQEMNPPKTFTVLVNRTQTVEVTVEAYSADDAETEAIEMIENGDVPSVDWDDDGELEVESVEEEE